MKLRFSLPVVLILTVCLLSCTTRRMKGLDMMRPFLKEQDYQSAIGAIKEKGKQLYGNINRFLYWFDLGLLYQYQYNYDSSTHCLENAEQVLDEIYARSVVNEAASLLTNDNLRPYRGRRYEQLLLHQFRAFNYLSERKYDEALVEYRKNQLVVDRFKDADGKREKFNDDGMPHFLASLVYKNVGESDNSAISLFKSVQAYSKGPWELPDEVGEEAYWTLKSQERDADIDSLGLPVPEYPFPDTASEIILIGYGGRGPELGEKRYWGTYVRGASVVLYYRDPNGDTAMISVPAPPLPESEKKKHEEGDETGLGTTFHVKFTIPVMVKNNSITQGFTLQDSVSGRSVSSFALTNVNTLLAADLEDNYLKTLARTAARVVLRTIALQRAKKELESKYVALNLLSNTVADVLSDQIEKADTRLCFLLPEKIYLCRLRVTPGVHTVKARACDTQGMSVTDTVFSQISVKPGEKRFVFLPSLI